MSRKFLTHVDLAKNELQNAVIQNLAAAPSSPVKGQLYFDTSTNTLYWWNGTAWIAASPGTGFPGYGAVTQEQTFGATKNDGVATTVSRSDHTHGNPVHDNAAHSAVNLNALAAPTADVSMNSRKITNLANPVALTDAVNMQYVQGVQAGLSWKAPVDVATTANVALSGASQTIDGITGWATILVKNQTTATENGLYDVNAGAWTRRADADVNSEFPGMAVFVKQGVTQADTAWTCTNDIPPTMGTTPINYVQFSGPGSVVAGAGLTSSGNTMNVGAGTGITVAADTVAFDTTFGDARYVDHTEINSYVPTARTLTTTAPLTGGGDLSANRTLAINSFTGTTPGAVPDGSAAGATTFLNGDGGWTVPAGTSTGTVRSYATDVGNASLTSITVTHNLNTLDVIVQVYRKASPFDQVECDVQHTSTTAVTLLFTTAPASAEYRVVVMA